MTESAAQIAKLAKRLPSLRDAYGLDPVNTVLLEQWANEYSPCGQSLVSAQFVLHVADPKREWECGKFDATQAVLVWDETHRTAYCSWVMSPWFAGKGGQVIAIPQAGRFCAITSSTLACQLCKQRKDRKKEYHDDQGLGSAG